VHARAHVVVMPTASGLVQAPRGVSVVSDGPNHTRVTRTRIRPHDIEGRFQKRSATGGHRAAAPGGEPRGDSRRDGPHIDESAQGAARRATSYHEVVAGPLPQPTGRNRPSEHAPFRRGQKGGRKGKKGDVAH
jgi:hypothetical protein